MRQAVALILLLLTLALLGCTALSLPLFRAGHPFFAVYAIELGIVAIACLVSAIALGFRNTPKRFRNQCPRCGYNLTGNVSGVCPECGTEWGRRVG